MLVQSVQTLDADILLKCARSGQTRDVTRLSGDTQSRWQLFRIVIPIACVQVYIYRFLQLFIVAFLVSTFFIKPHMHTNTLQVCPPLLSSRKPAAGIM